MPTNGQGNQVAYSGEAYAGLVAYLYGTPDFREYAEVQLTEALVAGKCYELRFFMSLGDSPTNSTVDGIGAYFTQNIAVQATNSVMSVVPQLNGLGAFLTDSTGWQSVVATYEAIGGERYLTLGNFNDDVSTTVQQLHPSIYQPNCYYYLDDVSLVEIPSACVTLGVEEYNGAVISIFPNPTDDCLHVSSTLLGNLSLTLVDGLGKTVLGSMFQGAATIDVSALPAGMYTCVTTSDRLQRIDRTKLVVR
ncbi:MAG: T9SS type A sorting domain-containing protein [Flavobacteriales bacterium]|nr:MAG: T9SS type A sorting domain-containing protein [Flavobacteriales bacterium]